jgi:hypothetical protein
LSSFIFFSAEEAAGLTLVFCGTVVTASLAFFWSAAKPPTARADRTNPTNKHLLNRSIDFLLIEI